MSKRTDIETLTAAIATMADRMATSAQRAGLDHDNYARRLDACSRQRRAMGRLLDALNRAQHGDQVTWGFAYWQMTVRDNERAIAKRVVRR
jgi:hypothetical protein